MPKFRDTILLAHASRLINTDEFVLLYDVNKPKNPDLPYTNYDHFDLDKILPWLFFFFSFPLWNSEWSWTDRGIVD